MVRKLNSNAQSEILQLASRSTAWVSSGVFPCRRLDDSTLDDLPATAHTQRRENTGWSGTTTSSVSLHRPLDAQNRCYRRRGTGAYRAHDEDIKLIVTESALQPSSRR